MRSDHSAIAAHGLLGVVAFLASVLAVLSSVEALYGVAFGLTALYVVLAVVLLVPRRSATRRKRR